MRSGIEPQLAFDAAARHIGQPENLKTEFKKVNVIEAATEWLRQSAFTLAGIPNQYSNTIMNTSNSNLEPRWATYLKAGVFLLPAVGLWSLSCIFILPKLREIYFGTVSHQFPAFLNLMIGLSAHYIVISGAIVLLLVLLERRNGAWPRYRRAAMGIGTFVVNSVVLVVSFAMVILALIAASNLYHPGK